MNDPTSSPQRRTAEGHAGLPERALRTGTLEALRELLEVSAKVGPAIAQRASLSRSELQALELLIAAPMGPAELARRLGVTTAASSGIVDRLTARGHVERLPHASDGRRTQVRVTDTGEAEVVAHLSPMFRALVALDSTLEESERAVVESYLRGAIDALRRLL